MNQETNSQRKKRLAEEFNDNRVKLNTEREAHRMNDILYPAIETKEERIHRMILRSILAAEGDLWIV